jgi:hypothetical protein
VVYSRCTLNEHLTPLTLQVRKWPRNETQLHASSIEYVSLILLVFRADKFTGAFNEYSEDLSATWELAVYDYVRQNYANPYIQVRTQLMPKDYVYAFDRWMSSAMRYSTPKLSSAHVRRCRSSALASCS